ncbi:alpha/beta hydrolase [Yoonia sediminilitoris]|uniref:Acetyl esterase/lipase n=1 Tax=Yoonia sediminilitoris TaxID=1286148 RepID=A0A2T6KFZ7_9RHOB|nr:alpha/beta hydrolase [Yoonia sediminilitoris]PUB14228.1 acetyl esterase/lipase [Yoonia sediminilitoris]RCW95159.1 acetyl esterase/lipase [Yoonia sediminilitoris]
MIDWNDAFDNSGYVPEAEAIRADWVQQAARLRDELLPQGRAQIDLTYGADPREVMDIFAPVGTPKGTLVFVHGGYWHMMDKSYWSHLAAGCLAHGWQVAIPSYPLAPQARISEITQSITAAVRNVADQTKGPLVLAGHSAGGHLVARMACKGVLPDDITQRLARVFPISGVHHLTPLLQTTMNDTLQLTETEALRESPVELDPAPGVPVTFWVGADERPEFLRQNRMAAERWAGKGADVRSVYEAGQDHFTVIGSLAKPDGPLTQEVIR